MSLHKLTAGPGTTTWRANQLCRRHRPSALGTRTAGDPVNRQRGYSLGRDELIVDDVDYQARQRVHDGWRIIALRVERSEVATY